MKVIFRLKSANLSDRENYKIMAHSIIRSWDNMKDLDAMVVSEDVEVYVVDSKAEVILDDDKDDDAIPVWYIIKWYEKRYKLGSTVSDDWERDILKEKIAEMHDDFKNKKFLDNKQESERFAQMVKEVIKLYNDWEKENEQNKKNTPQAD